MAAGYLAAGKASDVATFELLVRRLPEHRNFLITAGLQQAVEFLCGLHFEADELDYLRTLPQFAGLDEQFFTFLQNLRFSGDLFAVPEGTPVFPNEPLAIVRAPLVEAQLVETFLLATIAFQTTIASKAARCAIAAKGRHVVEFGSRRAHSPDAAVYAARAAYIGGCDATSNAEAGMLFDVPVSGTAAHSWVMSFASEQQAFAELQRLLGPQTVYLLDTYDTLNAVSLVTHLGQPLWGVRIDSGDLAGLTRQVRAKLDAAGLHDAKIMLTGDLDEHRIGEMLSSGVPVDVFGVGTQLATSADAPALSAVYKLVELRSNGTVHYTAKFSGEKTTLPAAKQVYRYADHDEVTLHSECNSQFSGRPLLQPVIASGRLIEPLPSPSVARRRAAELIAQLPPELLALDRNSAYDVRINPRLIELGESVRAEHRPGRQP